MNRENHNNVDFFVGNEVELTPAHSKKTLFVVGKQKLKDITKYAAESKAPHIFLGANHSFDLEESKYWKSTIKSLLDAGFMVTLDYNVALHQQVSDMLGADVLRSRNFIPMVSVRIPHILTSSNNLTIKIDDVDFDATNPGVWCMNYKEVTDSNRFTSWIDYADDNILAATVDQPAVVQVQQPPVVVQPVQVAAPVVIEEVAVAEPTPVDTPVNDADLLAAMVSAEPVSETVQVPEVIEVIEVTETPEVEPVAEKVVAKQPEAKKAKAKVEK